MLVNLSTSAKALAHKVTIITLQGHEDVDLLVSQLIFGHLYCDCNFYQPHSQDGRSDVFKSVSLSVHMVAGGRGGWEIPISIP